MSVPENEPSMPSIATDYEDSRVISVDTVTLSEYLDEAGIDRVDAAKLDVEGGEHAILCETDALNHLEALVCEVHPRELRTDEVDAIIERLSSTGTVTDLDDNPLPRERLDERDGPIHVVWVRD